MQPNLGEKSSIPDAPCMVNLPPIWLRFMVNVATYAIHGAFGNEMRKI